MPVDTVMPGPPRLIGDHDIDVPALHEYLGKLHQALVLESKLGDPSHQYAAGTFDAANLTDPSEATLASAQRTANAAYARALLP